MKNFTLIKYLFIFYFSFFSFLSAEDNHRIYVQTGWGFGKIINANDKITKDYNTENGYAYSALNQGEYIPIQSDKNKENSIYPKTPKWVPSHSNFEYRYKDKTRFYLERRVFESNGYNNNFLYFPSKDVSSGFIYDRKLFFQEERYKIGVSQFFSIFENFNLGLVANYYALQQISSKLSITELNPRYSKFLFATKDEKFYGWVPGLALELKIKANIEIFYSFELIQLRSSNSSIYSFSMLPINFSLDKIDNKITGNFNKLIFIYRPFSWFGLHLGFVKESYQKKYGNDLYLNTNSNNATVYLADLVISNMILRSNHFNQSLKYVYFQFEFSKGF